MERGVDREVHATAGLEAGATVLRLALLFCTRESERLVED